MQLADQLGQMAADELRAALAGAAPTVDTKVQGNPLYYDYGPHIDVMYRSGGFGGYLNQLQTFMTGIDRFQHHIVPINSEHAGLTFITRPKLCLASSNLRQSRIMSSLDVIDTTAMTYAIRCLLDTKYCKTHFAEASSCPLLNANNPFMTPLVNGLTACTGWPDVVLDTETTEGGFHGEDQTYALGSNILNRSSDLTLHFTDVQYGVIAAIFYYWIEYINNVVDGRMMAYAEDIDEQVLNYTVSIYRFLLDPSKRYITKFAKATGCFPKTHQYGAFMNFNKEEVFVQATQSFDVPFVANKIEYMDYGILMDFNILMTRWCPSIQDAPILAPEPINNYRGLPWINTTENGIELQFRDVPCVADAYPAAWQEQINKLYTKYENESGKHASWYNDAVNTL